MQSPAASGEGTWLASAVNRVRELGMRRCPGVDWHRRNGASKGIAGCSAAGHLAEPAKRTAVRFLFFLASCSIGHEARDGAIEL